MNEKGLFVDGNALAPKGWKRDAFKPDFKRGLMDTLLATCADVADVKKFFNTYNVRYLNYARFPVMDRFGNSMVVEWYNKEVTFLENDQHYQVATNFLGSAYVGKEKPCWRYNNAVDVIQKREGFSTTTITTALKSSAQNSIHSITMYSFVCDLKTGDIWIYNFGDFENPVKFNLQEEITKGTKEYHLVDLFENNQEYQKFTDNATYESVYYIYRENNVDVALEFYSLVTSLVPKFFDREVDETPLLKLADQLTADSKPEDAIKLLVKNIEKFPTSATSYLKLGRLYQNQGNVKEAKNSFQQALTLDPDNEAAKEALAR